MPLEAGSPVSIGPESSPAGSPARALLPLAFLILAAMLLTGTRARPLRVRAAVAVLLFVALAEVACGGDPAGPGTPEPPDPVTTTFTITGTSGELEHSTTATVRVE